jgi:thiol-disulfide isomerase/thioredoxin
VQPRITLCSVCHSQMPAGQSYCKNCGSTLCPHCRELLPQRSRFCPKCGFLCIVEQQVPAKPSTPPAVPGGQAIPIPRAVSTPQPPGTQAIPQQQPFGTPVAQHQRKCPKCGSTVDPELGRCTGCGLLYGTKHRVMQPQTAPAAIPPRPPLPSRPQSSTGQTPPRVQGTAPPYGNIGPGVPTSGFGQRPMNYSSPGTMPPEGVLLPIPSAAPAAAGATPVTPALPTMPHPYQAAPPTHIERGTTGPGKRGVARIFTTLFIIIVCLIVGGGIYYFVTGIETSPLPENTVNTTITSIQNVNSSRTDTSATITWKTDKQATGQVDYGKTKEYELTPVSIDELTTDHNIQLTGLEPNTTYYFKIISADAAGNEVTHEGELKPIAEADETAPTISGLNVSNVTESSAIITWHTNESATSQVKYSKSEEVSSTTPIDNNPTTDHSVTLTNLDSGTTYNYIVMSKDAAGNVANSPSGQTFTTESAIPVGSNVFDRAPDFTVQNPDGEDVNVNLRDYRGKIVMINFWATWCVPCKEEMPFIQAVSDNWSSQDLAIFSIAAKEKENLNVVNEFISDNGYTFPVYYDSQGQAKSLYNINIWPTTFLIDDEGIIRYMQVGSFSNQTELEDRLNSF